MFGSLPFHSAVVLETRIVIFLATFVVAESRTRMITHGRIICLISA